MVRLSDEHYALQGSNERSRYGGSWCLFGAYQGLYSLGGKTSCRKISWSLEAARFGFKRFQSLWNLAGTSAALLPRCLSNFRAIRPLQHPISRLRDFTRFGGKTSYRLVNRGPGLSRLHPCFRCLQSFPHSLPLATICWLSRGVSPIRRIIVLST